MREIKFRAWDSKNKQFFPSAALVFKLNTPFANVFPVGEIVFTQYTGLEDKNGVEIYEGDILKTGDKHYSENWPIEFIDGSFVLALNNNTATITSQSQVEVIGNIYENPELLEGVK